MAESTVRGPPAQDLSGLAEAWENPVRSEALDLETRDVREIGRLRGRPLLMTRARERGSRRRGGQHDAPAGYVGEDPVLSALDSRA